jgi:hypothetical protein
MPMLWTYGLYDPATDEILETDTMTADEAHRLNVRLDEAGKQTFWAREQDELVRENKA